MAYLTFEDGGDALVMRTNLTKENVVKILSMFDSRARQIGAVCDKLVYDRDHADNICEVCHEKLNDHRKLPHDEMWTPEPTKIDPVADAIMRITSRAMSINEMCKDFGMPPVDSSVGIYKTTIADTRPLFGMTAVQSGSATPVDPPEMIAVEQPQGIFTLYQHPAALVPGVDFDIPNVPQPGDPYPACLECGGKGSIQLFTSTVPCKCCGGDSGI